MDLAWKYGSVVTAMSTAVQGGVWGAEEEEEVVGQRSRSRAKMYIMASRCGNAAGLGALSALLMARRRSTRGTWVLSLPVDLWSERADSAMRWCARVGGLKEESRTRRVLGVAWGGWGASESAGGGYADDTTEGVTEHSTRSFALESW